MTHDDLRALIPAYAAGALEGVQAEALRTHLASGCAECLGDTFSRPVGLPRVLPTGQIAGPVRRLLPVAALLTAVAAAVLALLAVRAVADLRHREVSLRQQSDRHALEAADERASFEARIRRLERELEGARAEASTQAAAARAVRDENLQLEQALRTAQAEVQALGTAGRRAEPRPRPVAPAKPEDAGERGATAPPAGRLVQLTAVAPFRDPRGHALWDPVQRRVLLYAFDLPPLPAGARYRVRLRLADGRVETGPVLQPAADGSVTRLVPIGNDSAPPREVEVILDPNARPVLAGHIETSGP